MFDPGATAARLVRWLHQLAEQAKTEGATFGLSGGVDSAAVAGLCVRAFGAGACGLIMPCESDPVDAQYAGLLAEALQLRTQLVDLTATYHQLLGVLPGAQDAPRMARANLKARLRMVALYFRANADNLLVVGPGNLVELQLGYFTKYGDGAADALPLARLVKGQVRQLAAYLGVPEVIVDRPPSAGLWAGQTDEAELGISYQDLDRYFLTGEAEAGLRSRIERMVSGTQHKRCPPRMPE